MMKFWLASATAFALTAGVALAQGMPTEGTTQTTTSTRSAPADGSYSTSKTQTSIDDNGTETDKTQTYKHGVDGTTVSSTTQTKGTDGSQRNSYREEHTDAPIPGTTTTTTTTGSTVTR